MKQKKTKNIHKKIDQLIKISRLGFAHCRYRLVRHTWNLNVNESLCVDATCTLNDAASEDLGIDLYVKNQNQVHHALVTEIQLSDIKLFCPTYQLVADSIKCTCNLMNC